MTRSRVETQPRGRTEAWVHAPENGNGRRTRRALIVIGTRPEAIKLAPVVHQLRRTSGLEPIVCLTSQHRELLDQVLGTFAIKPHFDLDVMESAQSPMGVLAHALPKLEKVLDEVEPDLILVQGDTTSALAGALAGFHARIPIGHVEAGLRSGVPTLPFPEEANRRMISVLSTLHFAPTPKAARNLREEGVSTERIHITGNTVVDALHYILRQDHERKESSSKDSKLVLVTLHRRETLGRGLRGLCEALRSIAHRHDDITIVFPLHKNPVVRANVIPSLAGVSNIQLVEPLEYASFVRLLTRAALVITDSGGIQEEAAALGKTVLVARDVTERPEVMDSGCGTLIGTDPEAFEQSIERFLEPGFGEDLTPTPSDVFGCGQAAQQIVALLKECLFEEKRQACSSNLS